MGIKQGLFSFGLVVQMVRIPACHAGGREFESDGWQVLRYGWERLQYDYGFGFDEDYKDFPCRCRSKNCVGYIVRSESRWRIKKSKIHKTHR